MFSHTLIFNYFQNKRFKHAKIINTKSTFFILILMPQNMVRRYSKSRVSFVDRRARLRQNDYKLQRDIASLTRPQFAMLTP